MKVAIVKSRIYKGGVTQVLATVIQILNDRGIVPDLITLRCDIDEEIVRKNYGQNIKFNIKKIALDIKMPYEWHFLYFNLISSRKLKKYDLIIDSNNTSFLSQKKVPSINYTHYPRKDRVISNLFSLHLPDGPKKKFLDIKTDPFFIAKFLYRFNKKSKENELIICNSKFTAAKTREVYPLLSEIPKVIYPPVELEPNHSSPSKINNSVVSLGRFSEEKRQMEQLEIAKQLPDFNFRILGFKGDGKYFSKCLEKKNNEKITNVEIIPDPDFESIRKMMKESRFFIHNVRNEPFGISTVQAISQGCIPVVHSSGGSREIVNNPTLEFSDVKTCISKFEYLKSLNNDELLKIIDSIDLSLYSREHFMKEFNSILSAYFK